MNQLKLKATNLSNGKTVIPDVIMYENGQLVTKTYIDDSDNCHSCATTKQVRLSLEIGLLDSNKKSICLGDEVGVRDIEVSNGKFSDIVGVVAFKGGELVLASDKDYRLNEWLFEDKFLVELYIL